MDLWLVVLVYIGGISLVVLEALLPGMIIGFVGLAGVVISTFYGFEHHWVVGAGQIALAVVAIPFIFFYGSRRMALKADLSAESGGVSFAKDYGVYLGREGESVTDLRPAGIVLMDGQKVDVVTAGEAVEKGKRVRVVKVEGNRVVVRAL